MLNTYLNEIFEQHIVNFELSKHRIKLISDSLQSINVDLNLSQVSIANIYDLDCYTNEISLKIRDYAGLQCTKNAFVKKFIEAFDSCSSDDERCISAYKFAKAVTTFDLAKKSLIGLEDICANNSHHIKFKCSVKYNGMFSNISCTLVKQNKLSIDNIELKGLNDTVRSGASTTFINGGYNDCKIKIASNIDSRSTSSSKVFQDLSDGLLKSIPNNITLSTLFLSKIGDFFNELNHLEQSQIKKTITTIANNFPALLSFKAYASTPELFATFLDAMKCEFTKNAQKLNEGHSQVLAKFISIHSSNLPMEDLASHCTTIFSTAFMKNLITTHPLIDLTKIEDCITSYELAENIENLINSPMLPALPHDEKKAALYTKNSL